MSEIKLSTEEMQQINGIQTKNREIMFKFGQIEMSIIQLNKAKSEVTKEMENSINNEKIFAEQLREKYGNGDINFNGEEYERPGKDRPDINLDTGEFTPVK